MADVRKLPNPQHVLEEASDWLARLEADDAGETDRQQFEIWRNAHPLHARTFADLSATRDRFVAAAPLVRAVLFAQSINEAAAAETRKAPPMPLPSRMTFWSAAAALVVAAVGLFAWYLRANHSGTTFATAIGEHSTIALADGSTLELNSDSRARVDFTQRNRIVHLDRGEAFFTVAHDVERPFWVVGNSVWVRAVGTAFNVDVRSSGEYVTVSEGTVKVGALTSPLARIQFEEPGPTNVASIVEAGQEADFRGTALSTRHLTPTQLARSVGWRDGVLNFDNQP